MFQNLDEEIATELVVSYMMYEYKGSYVTYEELADTQLSFTRFLEPLKQYYKRERICLLYSIQVILAYIGDEDHEFFVRISIS